MSEISNMFLPNEEIFETLKAYVEGKSTYEVWVGRNKVKEQNNVVVFEEANNLLQSYSTTFDDTTRALSYNIEVYCNKNGDNYDAIKQISILILEVMQDYYKMIGGINAIMPDFDSKNKDSYRATLRFTKSFKPNRNKLI